jgi:cell division protein FtsA
MKEIGYKYASIDIGSEKIKLVIATQNEYGLSIESHASVDSNGVNRGEIVDKKAFCNDIIKLIKPYKRNIHSVITNISSSTITSSNIDNQMSVSGKVSEESINAVIKASPEYRRLQEEGRKVFHYPFNFKINHKITTKNPVGIKANYLQVFYNISHIDKQVIQNISNSFDKLGIEVENMIVSSVSLGDFILSNEQKHSGVCLLDIGSQSCDIVVFKENTIRLNTSLEFGGNDIDENIAYHYECDKVEAKKLKERYGFTNASNLKNEQFIGFKQFSEQKFLSNYELADVINQSLIKFFSKIKTIIKNQDIKVLGCRICYHGWSCKT